MATLGRRPTTSLLAKPRLWFAEREVAPGWTALLVPLPLILIFVFGSYSGNLLPWLHARVSFGWAAVAAIAIVAFAAGYAATEAAPPLAVDERRPPVLRHLGGPRVLALSLLCVAISFIKPTAAFASDVDTSSLAASATWWSIPFGICLWTLASVTIARETEQAGKGTPADPRRQWAWLVTLRQLAPVRRAAYLFLFVGTIVFTVLGSIPDVIWHTASETPAWRGHIYEPLSLPYLAFFFWAGTLAVTAWIYLAHAFRARPGGLPRAELRRAWYSVWAAAALIVVLGLFVLAGQGWLSEPFLDVLLALYAGVFVLMVVDASAVTRHRRIKASLRRRAIGASGTVAFAFALPLMLGLAQIRAALIAGVVAGAIPLAPVAFRALYGIERLPAREPTAGTSGGDSQAGVEPLFAELEQQRALARILVRGRG